MDSEKSKVRRYLVFGWILGSMGHGWRDLVGDYDDLDIARHVAENWDYYHIVDMSSGEIIEADEEYQKKEPAEAGS